jgi:broad-specificity NMP kinase
VLTFDSRFSGFKQIPRSQRLSPRRISVVGTIGSGKTTFARKSAKLLDVPHVELDALHWEPNWVEAPNYLFRERVKQSLEGDSWVVDGNYHQVRDIVWSRADTVVWLDYPFRTIIDRLARRTLRRILTHEELWNGIRNTCADCSLETRCSCGLSEPTEDEENSTPYF